MVSEAAIKVSPGSSYLVSRSRRRSKSAVVFIKWPLIWWYQELLTYEKLLPWRFLEKIGSTHSRMDRSRIDNSYPPPIPRNQRGLQYLRLYVSPGIWFKRLHRSRYTPSYLVTGVISVWSMWVESDTISFLVQYFVTSAKPFIPDLLNAQNKSALFSWRRQSATYPFVVTTSICLSIDQMSSPKRKEPTLGHQLARSLRARQSDYVQKGRTVHEGLERDQLHWLSRRARRRFDEF